MKTEWRETTIGESCVFRRGLTYSKEDEVASSANVVLRANNIDLNSNSLNLSELKYIKDEIRVPASKKVQSGSLLICTASGSKSHLGKVALIQDDLDFAFGGFMGLLIPSEGVHPKFLYYLCISESYLEFVNSLSEGMNINNLKFDELSKFRFWLPPFSEQERIVAILDEAFANIAIAKANTERALKYVEEVAFSELFQIFEEQYSKYPNVELKELAQSISDGDHSPPPKASQGVPFITIGNINKEELRIDFNDTFKVPRTYFDGLQTSRRPQSGDVLYTVTGSYGIPVLVEKEVEFCFQRHIGLVRPKATTSSRWLFFLFQTPQLKRQADEGATGTAQKTVSLGLLRSFRVPSTPLPDQVSCASACEKIQKWTDEAKCAYLKKLSALDELKRSLLNQAFSGQL